MAPRFNKFSFAFEKDEKVPKHDEGWAWDAERDPRLWHINGHDQFSHETYELASNIEDKDAADLLARAARRHIEASQLASPGFHDRVYIIYPQGE